LKSSSSSEFEVRGNLKWDIAIIIIKRKIVNKIGNIFILLLFPTSKKK
jgi:hypothetical protein